MNPAFYSILHVASMFVLLGYTFYAFSAPLETKKRVMMITGIAAVLAAVGGFGLQAKLIKAWPLWLIVKIVCWLALTALAGIGYRKRESAGALALVMIVIVLVALVMVYIRPFQG